MGQIDQFGREEEYICSMGTHALKFEDLGGGRQDREMRRAKSTLVSLPLADSYYFHYSII